MMDLVVFAQFTGCAGTGLFSDSSVRIMLQPSERLALQSTLMCAESGNFSLFCRGSATVGSTRAGKTEPQKQQQLDAAMHPMFAAMEVTQPVEPFDGQGQQISSQTTSRLLRSWWQMCSKPWRFLASLNPWFSISQRLLAMRKMARRLTR